ncbi:Cytochrome P450 1A5 [Holothuria leucospilota]|uniref:unspecific monooxygenase n=1 Tax=Holothuria leucospilota TaxID=206669 RepID=A0A9Q0YM74_HOLLE|nr:Cytochrome P450 1A5 [Holothuria leucospilota]
MFSPGSNFSPVAEQVATVCMPYVLLVLSVFLILKVFVLRGDRGRRPKHLQEPPGPLGFPIIGNVLQLRPNPPVAFANLAKKFGNVIKLKIGSRPVIVLNSYRAIQQALVRQSVSFSGRPDFIGFRKVVSLSGGLLSFCNYDEGWKLHRKLVDTAIRHFTSGQRVSQIERQVEFEAKELINFILGKNKTTITKLSNLLRFSGSNVIVNALFHVRHELDNVALESLVKGWGLMINEISGSNMIDFMPWLRPFLTHKVKAFEAYAEHFVGLLQDYLREHRENYEKGMDSDICYYLRTLWNNMDILEREKITEKKVMSTVYDFFGAGLETVAVTLEWAYLYAIYYPDLQDRMHAEIDRVVGRKRLPTLADRGNLPYTEAFLVEVSRHSFVLPNTLPHLTTRGTVLEGGFNYFIPKDTVVFINLYGIQRDPELWENPHVFSPGRFLTEDGSKLDTAKAELLMRFGGGRRRCPGSELAQMEMFLFFTIMLHQCDLKNVGGQNLSLEGEISMLLTKPPSYQMEITRRT